MIVRTGKGLGGGVWPIAALIATEELNGVCSTKALVSMTASLESFQTTQLASKQIAARCSRRTTQLAKPLLTPNGAVSQGHYTHEKNPVGCAAGLATIDYVFDEGLMENAEAVGAHCLERMRGMMERQPMIGDVRGIGLLMGIVSRMSLR